MRCVVTGAAGFVGSTLTETLLEQGHEVLGLDCFTPYYSRAVKEANLERATSRHAFAFVEADLQHIPLEPLFSGADVIFHLAAQAGVRASWGKEFSIYTGNNILATQRVLEAARTQQVRESLRKIVYASSSSVYGDAESFPTVETVRPQPISPYGVSKLAAEHLMVLYSKEFGVPTASVRYFTVYGPRQRPDMAFHTFLKAGLQGAPIELYGDGEQSRDFTYIADAVSATIAAASARTPALVCNIGGGSRVTVNEVLATIENVLNRKLKVFRQPQQAGDARHTSADTTLARQELNYRPSVSLEAGLRAEAAWLEQAMARE